MPRARPFRGWYVVAAAFCLLFAGFGVAYSFGAFFTALADAFDASRAAVSAVFAWAAFLIFMTGAVSGPLADRLGPRPVVATGLLGIVAGLLGSAASTTLTGVTLWFTLGVGAGLGCVYVPTVGAVQRWFLRRRGLASGIAVTGIGLGTLLMPVLAGMLLGAAPWPVVFRILAAIVAVIGGAAVLFLDADPARHGQHPDGAAAAPDTPTGAGTNARLAPMLRSRPFLQLYAAQAVMGFAVLVPFVHVVPYAEDRGIERAVAATLVSLIGLGSTLGRVLIGGFADRLGRRPTLVALYAGLAASYLLWLGAGTLPGLVAFTLCFGLCYGGYIALVPALIADYFAGPRLSSVIGVQYTSAGLGSLLGPVTVGWLFDLTGRYTAALGLTALLAALATLLLAALPPPRGEVDSR